MGMKEELLGLSEYTWNRTKTRLEGITDDEYLWSPVAGAWSVRALGDGRVVVDGNLWPGSPPPFTNLAWRIAHLVGVYGSARNARWLRIEPVNRPIDDGHYAGGTTAAEALEQLDRAAEYWHEVLHTITEEALAELLGPIAGVYAEGSLASFALHQIDEAIHHGAEIAVLRDLYYWQHEGRRDEPTVEALRSEPNGVARAADLGRWDLVEQLVRDGAEINTPGRTALHQAAALGDLGIVRLLLAHGARTDAIDPDFNATPAAWARTFYRRDVVEYLESQSS